MVILVSWSLDETSMGRDQQEGAATAGDDGIFSKTIAEYTLRSGIRLCAYRQKIYTSPSNLHG
jgi:hypothetical protein